MDHELKTWPEFFAPLACGDKTAELRRDDRPYAVGDTLRLREWDPKREMYTGFVLSRLVTSVLRNIPGLKRGFCLISVKPLQAGVNTQFFPHTTGKRKGFLRPA